MAITQLDRQLKITTPLDDDFLLIQKITAHENISQLFRFDLELLHEETEAGDEPTTVKPEDVLGQNVTVQIVQRDGVERFWNGIVVQFAQGQRDDQFTHYRAVVVPDLWRLTQIHQSQIFQNMSVPDILKKMMGAFDTSFEFQATYEPRNYCVQYRETDFDFISRLMEEEGIYYYFEHSDGSHKIIVADTPQSHLDCPNKDKIEFSLESGGEDDFQSVVSQWFVEHNLQTGKYTLWDFNFQLPNKNLEAQEPTAKPVGGNDKLEIYDYPGGYARRFDGITRDGGEQTSALQHVFEDNRRTTKIRMQEIDARHQRVTGASDSASFHAGYRFTLENHPTADNNGQYILTRVTHTAIQTPDYATNAGVPQSYQNEFDCLPHGEKKPPYRPSRRTPKPYVRGSQTAMVAGVEGEEIFTDKYGRVKVQFHWDRDSKGDATSSCWIRVAQSWAGKNWGMMFIPRVGMEVIVDFIEGDPDQPIITGCVYNAETMPPYDLPAEKTKMTIKSDSSKGGSGWNEIRFEDLKDEEQIFIHGQKDVDIRNKKDRREWVGRDHHFTVKQNRREHIEKDEDRIIKGTKADKIDGDDNLKVGGKQSIEVGGSISMKADSLHANFTTHSEKASSITFEGSTIVLKASAISLISGGNSVNVNGAGVQIVGSIIGLNSGGAPAPPVPAVVVPPVAPKVADIADDDKPGTKAKLEKRSNARQERFLKASEEDEKKKSWIGVKLLDEAGKPVPGERFKVTTSDGTVKYGTTNEKGEGKVKGIEPGNCQVTFPNLDKEAWEE